MSDDEDADANEQAFAKLQENLEEQEDAEKEANRLSELKPGDSDYDAILVHYVSSADPDGDTCKELSALARQWLDHREKLFKRETELFDALCDQGYDMRDYYVMYHIKPKMRRLEKDPVERAMRVTVDALLDKQTLQETVSHSGAVKTFVAGGASGYIGHTDDQELADVDVLDGDASADEDDRPADKLRVYSEEFDDGEVDTAVSVDDSGAHWMLGFRISQILRLMLKEHQQEASDMCLKVLLHGGHGVLIAHGIGLGKTLTTLATLEAWTHRFKQARAIVCCPRSVIHQWGGEVANWESIITINSYAITDTDAHLVRQLRPWFKHGGVVIVGHDQFKRTHKHFGNDEHTIFIVDEAHVLKQNTTEFYEVVDGLETNRKIFLSGSPVQNNLIEYYKLLQLLAPGVLAKNQATFLREYAEPIKKGLKADGDDGEEVGASNDEAANYGKIVLQQMVKRLDRVNDEIGTKFVLQESSDKLQTTLEPNVEYCLLHTSGPVTSDVNVINERHNVHGAVRPHKVELVLALIRSIRQQTTENIVVFSMRNTLLEELHKIEPGFLYTGNVNIDRRDKIMHDFPSKPGDVIYIATKADGVGLNITAASRVILADLSWNPVDDNQAVARCWRMGQQLPVFVYRLVADGTLEKGIYLDCISKHKVALNLWWGNHEGTYKEAENYTRQDLYLLMNQGQYVSLSLAACGDLVLVDVAMHLAASAPTILDHDAQFEHAKETAADDDDEGDEADEADDDHASDKVAQEMQVTMNDSIHNKLSNFTACRMVRQDYSVQFLPHDRHTLDDNTLCAPHPPVFFMRDTDKDKDKKEMSSYMPAVYFNKKQEIFIQVGPEPKDDPASAFADTDKIQIRLEYCCHD